MTSVGVGAMKIWWRFGLLATRQKDMDDLLVDAVEDSYQIYQVSCNSLNDRIGQFFRSVNALLMNVRCRFLLPPLIPQMVCASAKLRW